VSGAPLGEKFTKIVGARELEYIYTMRCRLLCDGLNIVVIGGVGTDWRVTSTSVTFRTRGPSSG